MIETHIKGVPHTIAEAVGYAPAQPDPAAVNEIIVRPLAARNF